jgi:rfaE bifunctional protein kinase chain/domain
VLVVGDLFLDEYLEGRAERLSREAPVPVVELTRRVTIPGGAANPARNVVALGSRAIAAGLVGADEAGRALLAQLQADGVDIAGVVVDPGRVTTTKTRVVAFRDALRFPQHLARVDRVDRTPLAGEPLRRLVDRLEALAPQAAALLVSDYRSGAVTPAIIAAVIAAGRAAGALLAADAQGNLAQYAGFDLVKCNRAEAEAELGVLLDVDADYERGLARLLPRLGARMCVITRGPEGLSAQEQGQPAMHLAAANRSEVFDVTGAGDTVVAVLALAVAAGLSLRIAAHLANAAAGLVVRRVGNAVVTPAELAAAIESSQ